MDENRLLLVSTSEAVDIFNQLSRDTACHASTIDDKYLQTDLFCLFYLQNPVLKEIEDVSSEFWINYFLLKGLFGHPIFKNIQSFTKDYSDAAYWLTQKFMDEYKLVNETGKMQKFLKDSNKVLSNVQNINDLKNRKNILKIEKRIKKILSKIILSLNEYLKKLEPLLELAGGHNIAPLSLRHITGEKVLQLAEKLQKPKLKETIKIFIRSSIKEPHYQEKTGAGSKPALIEPQAHDIFYINDPTQDKSGEYKNWLCNEIKKYEKNKIYRTQLTAYINPGNFMSKNNELESLSFSISLLEVARLERRNCMMMVASGESDWKTFIFKNTGQAGIFKNDQYAEFSFLDGLVALIEELLVGRQLPVGDKRKKIFKKPTEFIKFT